MATASTWRSPASATDVLTREKSQLFVNTGRALFTLGVIAVSTPIFLVLVPPLGFIYIIYQKYYLRTSRELKRLDSVSRSPIYAHFQESLGGVSTIRAYRQQARFTLENEWRMDANLRAYFPSVSANRWLAVRLEFIGSFIIFSAAGFAIISVTTGSGLSAGMVGLAVSSASSLLLSRVPRKIFLGSQQAFCMHACVPSCLHAM